MRGTVFGQSMEIQSGDTFTLQNRQMLKVQLNGKVLARQGAMVAYQGDMDFAYKGAGLKRLVKKMVTGEGLPLMSVSGRGDLFLANSASEIHLVHLDNESMTVNGDSILAFEANLDWDVKLVRGIGKFGGGGWFNTELSGTGWLAMTAYGIPVTLRTDEPTYVDIQSAVAWSSNLKTGIKRTVKLGSLVGRGSGENIQMSFTGDGFVVVQASEGRPEAGKGAKSDSASTES